MPFAKCRIARSSAASGAKPAITDASAMPRTARCPPYCASKRFPSASASLSRLQPLRARPRGLITLLRATGTDPDLDDAGSCRGRRWRRLRGLGGDREAGGREADGQDAVECFHAAATQQRSCPRNGRALIAPFAQQLRAAGRGPQHVPLEGAAPPNERGSGPTRQVEGEASVTTTRPAAMPGPMTSVRSAFATPTATAIASGRPWSFGHESQLRLAIRPRRQRRVRDRERVAAGDDGKIDDRGHAAHAVQFGDVDRDQIRPRAPHDQTAG